MENALVLIDRARKAGSLIFSPPNLETTPLYKAEVTQITARPDEFHKINEKYMPNKAVVDRIGDAAGIDFLNASCGVRAELRDDDIGKRTVFIGYAQGRTRLPDGSWRQSSVEEYEFDPLLRAKIEKESSGELAVKAKYMEYAKTARQRASTGARVRVIRQLVGMPVTFSDAERKTPLVFSRIVQNTDYILSTHEGQMMAIAMATGAANLLYGPKPAEMAPASAAQEAYPEDPPDSEPRNVTPSPADLAAEAAGDDSDPFGIPSGAPSSRLEELQSALTDWSNSEGQAAVCARKIIARGEVDIRILEASVSILKYATSGCLKPEGIAACYNALEHSGTDPIVLDDIAKKGKNAFEYRSSAKAGA